MTQLQIFNVYLISDSSGETVSVVLRAAASQLPEIKIIDHIFPLVKTNEQIDEILKDAMSNNGIIMCTIADQDLNSYLKQKSREHKIICLEVLSKIIKEMANYFKTAISHEGRQFEMEEENPYLERAEAINYTIAHDDGQNVSTLYKADIILVGISRTSKSPTSIYLANRGYKVANVPIIPTIHGPEELFNLKNKCIIALVIDPERLMVVRKQRMRLISPDLNFDYTAIESIFEENEQSIAIYNKYRWPMIDVTEKSVEEIAALIIQYFNKYKKQV